MATRKVFSFSGLVESVRFNPVTTAVFLPHHIVIGLPAGRVKTNGIINGVPFSLSILYRKEVGRYLPLSAALRSAARLEVGDAVNVTFSIIDKDRIEFQENMDTVLDQEDKSRRVWKTLTVAMNRMLPDFVANARMIDMRIRKALEMVQKGRATLPQPDGTRKKKNS
jgi:hypothetical protein